MSASNNRSLNRLGRAYERTLGRWIPREAVFSLIFTLIFELMTYYIAKKLILGRTMHRVDIALDHQIPQRYEWILVYFGAFLFWGISFILVSRRGKERWHRFFTANIFALIVCGVLFVAYPTYIERPELTGSGFFYQAMRFLYWVDTPVNIFPSVHCMASWLCFLGLRSDRTLPRAFRAFELVFALMICASTLLVKQHCIADVIAGVALAQGFYLLFGRTNTYRLSMKLFDRLDRALFFTAANRSAGSQNGGIENGIDQSTDARAIAGDGSAAAGHRLDDGGFGEAPNSH